MSRRFPPLAHLAVLIGLIFLAFIGLQQEIRSAEASVCAFLLRLVAGDAQVSTVDATSVLVLPLRGAGFQALITPACSSVAPVLALLALASLTPHHPWHRRALAAGAAVAMVVVGNLVRITASLAVGLSAGPSSLVLFHDWVGSIFAFGYILGGYVLMLSVLLRAPALPAAAREPAHA